MARLLLVLALAVTCGASVATAETSQLDPAYANAQLDKLRAAMFDPDGVKLLYIGRARGLLQVCGKVTASGQIVAFISNGDGLWTEPFARNVASSCTDAKAGYKIGADGYVVTAQTQGTGSNSGGGFVITNPDAPAQAGQQPPSASQSYRVLSIVVSATGQEVYRETGQNSFPTLEACQNRIAEYYKTARDIAHKHFGEDTTLKTECVKANG